ncbi:hypothetical protein LZ32DRAFT_616736 [Colletotrichum eremochloae]|nr:hypothetical protein LZ32DRAFT_616736 [Colletotrichum eremochloae]
MSRIVLFLLFSGEGSNSSSAYSLLHISLLELIWPARRGLVKRIWRDLATLKPVRVGDNIACSGQGGCDPKMGEFYREINAQIDQAFANVDLSVKDAGCQGWE